MNAMDFFPWSARKVLGRRDGHYFEGEPVTARSKPRPGELPRVRHQIHGPGSIVSWRWSSILPVPTFAVLRNERCWTETEVSGFKLIAQVIAGTLARAEAEKALREREAGLRLAINVVGNFSRSMNLDTQEVWVAAKTRELWAFPPDEELTYQSFSKVIHPDVARGVTDGQRYTDDGRGRRSWV